VVVVMVMVLCVGDDAWYGVVMVMTMTRKDEEEEEDKGGCDLERCARTCCAKSCLHWSVSFSSRSSATCHHHQDHHHHHHHPSGRNGITPSQAPALPLLLFFYANPDSYAD
jgi:hypothetical protein